MTLAGWLLKTSVAKDPTASLDYMFQGQTTCPIKKLLFVYKLHLPRYNCSHCCYISSTTQRSLSLQSFWFKSGEEIIKCFSLSFVAFILISIYEKGGTKPGEKNKELQFGAKPRISSQFYLNLLRFMQYLPCFHRVSIGIQSGTGEYTLLVAVFIDQCSSRLKLRSYN